MLNAPIIKPAKKELRIPSRFFEMNHSINQGAHSDRVILSRKTQITNDEFSKKEFREIKRGEINDFKTQGRKPSRVI